MFIAILTKTLRFQLSKAEIFSSDGVIGTIHIIDFLFFQWIWVNRHAAKKYISILATAIKSNGDIDYRFDGHYNHIVNDGYNAGYDEGLKDIEDELEELQKLNFTQEVIIADLREKSRNQSEMIKDLKITINTLNKI